MKSALRSIIMAVAVLVGTAGAVWAQNTIYVNQAVASSGDGLTPGTAKKTVAEGLAVADVTGNLIDPSTADLWTLFDAAVAWADNVTLPVTGGQAALIVSAGVFAEGLANTTTPDGLIHDRLVSIGYTVEVVSESAVTGGTWTTTNAEAKDLVVICESVGSSNMDPLIGANVPIVSNEAFMYDNWNWATSNGANRPGTQITITNAGHPLAGGLSGTVDVYTEQHGISTVSIVDNGLVASAQVVASVVGDADKVAIFGLEAGAALHVGTAPARRVGFLIFSDPNFLRRDFPAGLKVAVAQGVYPEAATLQMGGYRLEGGWNPTFTTRNPATNVTTLDGLQNKRIMEIIGVGNFTVDGFTFFHGAFTATDTAVPPTTDYFGGGFLVDGCTSGLISNCIFDSNTMTGTADEMYGGALAIDDSSEITVSKCTFTNNMLTGVMDDSEGGAMQIDDGINCTVIDCTFTDNQAVDAAATYDAVKAGGLAVDDCTGLLITGCTFTRNSCLVDIGALLFNESDGVVSDCVFTENSASNNTAAMELDSANVTVKNCTFDRNVAGNNGVLFLAEMYLFDDGADNTLGTADDSYELFTATIDGCLFTSNTVSNNAIILCSGSSSSNMEPIEIINCVFVNNTATNARLLDLKGLNVLVANNTFYGNTNATGAHIRIYNVAGVADPDGGEVAAMVTDPFVLPNQAEYDARVARFVNNILVQNSSGNDRMLQGRDHEGWLADWTFVANNIFFNNLTAPNPGRAGNTAATDITLDGRLTGNGNFDADPLFVNAAVANFHLQAASQAIDAGLVLTEVPTDFDGATRPYGALHDIGAFEYTLAPPAPTNLTATAGDQQVLLRWDLVTEADGYRVFQSLTSGGPYTEVGTTAARIFLVTGLTNDTTYYFVVRAFNFAGDSGNSNEVEATPTIVLRASGWHLYR